MADSTLSIKNRKILLVDDDASIAALTKLVLEELGYSVTVLPSAAEALQELQRQTYEWLIADLRLGAEFDGLTLCEEARAIQPALKLTLFTGMHIEQELLLRITDSGITLWPKPCDINALSEIVPKA
jgi:CheY-like chemotaxis protein